MTTPTFGLKKILLLLTLMISFCSSTWAVGNSWVNTDYNTTEGTDFWLTNMFNYGNTQSDSANLKLRLFAVSRQRSEVTVTYLQDNSTQTFIVNANSRHIFSLDLSKCYLMSERNILRKGVHVTSTTPISLYTVSQNSIAGSQDATCVLPTSALGREYVIQTYKTDGVSTEFSIVATRYTPSVTMTIKRVNDRNPQNTLADTTITIGPLSAGDAYLFRSQNAEIGLSGTSVCSDAPIAVFSGGQHADIPWGANKNHVYSQLNPVNLWGNNFVITNTKDTYIDYIRFSSAENNNSLQVFGTNNSYSVVSADIGAMGTYTDSIELFTTPFTPKADVYKSDKLSECFLYFSDYTRSQEVSVSLKQLGAPAMTPITPMEYGMRSVIFTTLQAPNIQNHYVNIVTYQATKNYMQLDGASIGSLFQDIPGTPYSFCEIQLDTTVSAHILQNNRRDRLDGVFTARVYGLGKYGNNGRRESYAYSAGARVCSSADMLIDDKYIKSKTICINKSVKFTSIVNYDYSSLVWDFGDGTYSSDSIAYKRWDESGIYPINMIVGRSLPPCNIMHYDTVKATIIVKDRFNKSVNKKLCQGSVYSISGLTIDSVKETYTFSNDVDTILHFYTVNKCDSIVNVKIQFGTPSLDTISISRCDSFVWRGNKYFDSGEFRWDTISSFGCDSSEVLQLTINKSIKMPVLTDTVCRSELPYIWEGMQLYNPRTYTKIYQTKHGCDSLLTLNLKVGDEFYDSIARNCCDTDLPYVWRGRQLTETGIYYDSLKTKLKCDSIYVLNFTIRPHLEDFDTLQKCAREFPFWWHKQLISSEGDYADWHVSKYGCDSSYYVHVVKLPEYRRAQNVTLCEGEYFVWEGDTLQEAKTYSKHYTTKLGCDSTLVLNLRINRHSTHTIRVDRCDNELPYIDPNTGISYWRDTTIVDTLVNAANCDSILTIHFFVHPTYFNEQFDTICEMALPYHYADSCATRLQNLSVTGTYVDTLRTVHNCDSVIQLHLTVLPTTYKDTNVVWCESAGPYLYGENGKTAFADGEYRDTLQTRNMYGCDSVLIVHLHILRTQTTVLKDTICSNYLPYNFSNPDATRLKDLTRNGVYTDTLHTDRGCDSILELHLFVAPFYEHQEETIHLCEGETLLWNGILLDGRNGPLDSLIVHPMRTVYGCDSIIYLDWHVHPVKSTVIDTIICERESPYYHPDSLATRLQNLSVTGTYVDTLRTVHNCDSVIQLHLTVLPTTHYYETKTTCRSAGRYYYGEHDNFATESGDYEEVLNSKNQYGCDSIYHLHLIVLETIVDSQVVDWCDNAGPYNFPDSRATNLQGLVTSDIYRDTLKSINDCDSIIVLDFRVHAHTENTIRVDRCDNELPYIDPNTGISYWRDTTIIDTLVNAVHCDSILTIHFYVHPTYFREQFDTICEMALPYHYADPRATRLQNLYATNTYYDTIPTINNCDSVIQLHLTVHPTTHYYDTVTTCRSAGPYLYGENGKTATETDDYIDTLRTLNQYGCDSIYHLHLIVLETIVDSQVVDWCDNAGPYNFPDSRATNLQGLVTSDIYRDTLKSINDCDSIIVLDFRVHAHTENTIRVDRCDNELPYVDPNTGLSYWRDTTIIDTLVNAVHCDSILTIHFYVHPTYFREQFDTICEMALPYHYADPRATRLQNLYATNTYYDTIPTINNCDSVIQLHLTVHPTTYKEISVSWCESDGPYPYGENGKTAFADGEYRDTLQTPNVYGCDSVLIVHLHILRTQTTILKDTICSNYLPYNYSNPAATRLQGLTDNGIYPDTIQTAQGCDSILILHLFVPSAYLHQEETIHMCEGETMLWNGILLDGRNGPLDSLIVHPMQTVYGCDSIIYLDWHVHPTYLFVTDTIICQYDTIEWRGNKYWATDDYYDSLQTQIWGCDSVYKLHLYMKPAYRFHKTMTVCSNDTLWYPDNILREQIVWRPDYPVDMDYISLDFLTAEGCDSSYIYHLTIHPAYLFESSASWCSNASYEATYTTSNGQVVTHQWQGIIREYDQQDTLVLPLDTLLEDVYQTVNDCDSVFRMSATIFPAYRHVDYDTICDNEWLIWRNNAYGNFSPGDSIIRETYQTTLGCDSIFELRVHVHPTYFYEINDTICDGDTYFLNGNSINYNGDSTAQFFTDSLASIFGCDSVYHLYLTVLPLQYDTIKDTICIGEKYDFMGKMISAEGHYRDTATTDWGCYHFTDLFLSFIEPTHFKVEIDSVCADDAEIEVRFSYQGRQPLSYLVDFDPQGENQHFIDFDGIFDTTNLYVAASDSGSGVLYLPIWRGDELPRPQKDYYDTNEHMYSSESKYEYVRPDDYQIKLYFDNGICRDSVNMLVNTSFSILYPDWLTEQHWNDAIVLYNEKYNGGYEWSAYQWYKDGAPLPGQDTAYYYNPQELEFGHEYQVLLTRADDGKSILTCPIIPMHLTDTITPNLYYLSVVPTLVSSAYPVVNIMHSENCWYKVIDLDGNPFNSNYISCKKNSLNATEVHLPALPPGSKLVLEMRSEDFSYKRVQIIIYKP